ncbi:MAG: DNA polymerase III subunit gamma/tau, partial [Acidobacteriota bacterium]
CVEIAQGRDMDVMEIDAATNTQVDKVRDVIISGLGIAPVRNRYKIFIIDEVHRLSHQSFDALLKSIEEPPPHVVFMMATTELEKVPATIQSRSQVFELKTIGIKPIADQLRRIAEAEQIRIDDAAVMLIARAGDGSMRDAQSAFDQVIAFAGESITADDVSTVLGLVRRDLLFDVAEAVAREDGAAAFELAGQAVESGYDLRQVVRELARLTRDILVVNIDPARVSDPELAAEAERERLKALASMFSTEDLMRAFDVLTKAEFDIRGSAYPRYHLEMALLRWIHLRKLVPIGEMIAGLEKGAAPGSARALAPAPSSRSSVAAPRAVTPPVPAPRPVAPPAARDAAPLSAPPAGFSAPPAEPPRHRPAPPRAPSVTAAMAKAVEARQETAKAGEPLPDVQAVPAADLKDAFLSEIRRVKKFFYGAVIAQAQRIDIDGDRVVFTFGPQQRSIRIQLDQTRTWLDALASQLAGRKMTVVSAEGAGTLPDAPGQPTAAAPKDRQSELRQQALADTGVQAMLDVFAAEIKDVEER